MLDPGRDVIGKAMELLRNGLGLFVQRELIRRFHDKALEVARRYLRDDRGAFEHKAVNEWDVAALLKLIWFAWREVFEASLGPTERSLVQELRGWRNKWAHQERMSSDDVERILDSASRLLVAIKAVQADEVKTMRLEFRQSSLGMAQPTAEEPFYLDQEVIGSANLYHRRDCHITRNIWRRNRKRLRDWTEAVALGLSPCTQCNPPYLKIEDDSFNESEIGFQKR